MFAAAFWVLLPESTFPIDKAADKIMSVPSLPLFIEQNSRLKYW